MNDILSWAETNSDRILDELAEFISIPSISTDSESRDDVNRAAAWLCEHLNHVGLRSEVMSTSGHPVVYGEWLGAPGKPTILIYGHYDVQPPEPLDLWNSPPFELTHEGEKLVARGISDDKGQLFVHVKALESCMRVGDALPVNVKVIFEGEEEIGSRSLPGFLKSHSDLLKADVAVISDNPMLGRGLPAVGYGLRGMVYLEVTLEGPASDLHSGRFGGAVANPANVLCRLVSELKRSDGHIMVPGFYDRVRDITDDEKQEIRNLPLKEEDLARLAGVPALSPEKGFHPIECLWARPSLDVNGLTSGFQGEGAKTIIPSSARAKISCRIVPDQDPSEILDLLESHLKEQAPDSVRITIRRFESAHPAMVDRNDPRLQLARKSLEEGFEKPCYLIRQGGTIPVVSLFKQILDLNTLLIGFGLPDENAHAPNEFLLKENFFGGLRSIIRLLHYLGDS